MIEAFIKTSVVSSLLARGQKVVCLHGNDGLWKLGMIENVETEENQCIVRFTHFNAIEAIPFESIINSGKWKQL